MPNTNNRRSGNAGDDPNADAHESDAHHHDDMNAGNRPVRHVHRGGVQAAIWMNTGRRGPYFAVTFERRYKDERDEWQTSHAFGRDQLLVLAKVAEVAFHAIHELQRGERSQERVNSPTSGSSAGRSPRARSSR